MKRWADTPSPSPSPFWVKIPVFIELADTIRAKFLILLGLNIKFFDFSRLAMTWSGGNYAVLDSFLEMKIGGSRRLFAFPDLYSYFIKLTLFTTPTFADLFFVWYQDFEWFSARSGG